LDRRRELEINAKTALAGKQDKHEIVAENLHLSIAFARSSINLNVISIASIIYVNEQATGRFIKMLRIVGKQAQSFRPYSATFLIIEIS